MKKYKNLGAVLICAVASSLFLAQSASAVDFKADGFGSAYYGQALSSSLLPYGFTSTNPDFTDFSLIGADLMAKFDDNWSAGAEVVAGGGSLSQTNYINFVQWAYVNWTPLSGLSLKVGRQRYGIWSASEYINKHFDLPYREMPAVVYRVVPFSSFDGASLTQTAEIGDGMKVSGQVFGGTPILGYPASTVATFTGERLLGVRANIEGDGWRIRAQASRLYESIAWGSPYSSYFGSLTTGNTAVYTAGYRFDKYNIVSWGEYGLTNSKDGNLTLGTPAFRLAKTGYVLIGYRIDKFMPRYTFAQSSLNQGIESGQLTTHTIGLNYQANDHVIVKAEFELDLIPTAQAGPDFLETQPTSSTSTSGSAFYVGADFVI